MRRVLLVSLLLMPGLCAAEKYFDFAEVIAAEPIHAAKRVPVRAEVCAAAPDALPPGDARRDRPDATIGELVRADDRRRRPQCRTVTRYEQQQQVTGWRVRYRYAGKTYERRLPRKPGARIRVRVDLDPG